LTVDFFFFDSMKMELICSSNESVITKVIQIQEQCKRNNIEVAVNQLKGMYPNIFLLEMHFGIFQTID